jgi:hypothetical protein
LFVAISINLTQVLQLSYLPMRALEALATLMSVLFVSTIGLIPHQPAAAVGAEITLTGVVTWAFHIWALTTTHKTAKGNPRYWLRVILNLVPAPTYIVGGAFIAGGIMGGGLWIAAGILLSFSAAVLSSWVLLIEINR